MAPIVLQSLGYVNSLHLGFLELLGIQNELVGIEPSVTFEEYPVMAIQPGSHVVSVENGYL